MTRINKLITILAILVFLPKISAQQSQESIDQVLENINSTIIQIENSNYRILLASRSTVIKYVYGKPVYMNNFLSYMGEELTNLEEYVHKIILDANQVEELTGTALKLSVVKELSSNIEAIRGTLGSTIRVFAHAIVAHQSTEVFRAYRLLYNEIGRISYVCDELKDYVSNIDANIYATYDVRIRLVDADGNELPEDTIISYVATNIATQNIFFSTEDENIEDSGYEENTVFRGLQNGIYTFEGYGGIEITDQEFFIEKSLVNDEGYIEIIVAYKKQEENKFDVKIELIDTEGKEVPTFLLPGYKVRDNATGDFVYDSQNEVGSVIGLVRGLPKGSYDFSAYSGGSHGATSCTIQLSEELVNEEGFIVVTLQYLPVNTTSYNVKISLEDRNGTVIPLDTLQRYVAKDVATGNAVYDSQDPGGRNIGVFNELSAGTYRFDAYDGYFDGANNNTVTLSSDMIDENGFITITLGYWSE